MIRMISSEERMSVTYEQLYLLLFVSNDRTNLSVRSNVKATIVILAKRGPSQRSTSSVFWLANETISKEDFCDSRL